MIIVPTSVKLPENMRPRYLEDEGLYVGERPPVSLANENVLENRILKTKEVMPRCAEQPHSTLLSFFFFFNYVSFLFKGKKWFGDDGRIIALPNPIKDSSTRPLLFHMEEKLDPELQPVYRRVRSLTFTTLYLCIHTDKYNW